MRRSSITIRMGMGPS